MTARLDRRIRLAMVAMTVVALAACNAATTSPAPSAAPAASAGNAAPATTHKPVTISVGVLRPGARQEAVDALNLQVSEFQAKYPWITVETEEYNWTAPTFTAALAAGTLPTVFTIPFTDGKGLIAEHQIVNVDSRIRTLPYVDKFNPNVLVNGQDSKGQVWAVPIAAYGMEPAPQHPPLPPPRPRAAHTPPPPPPVTGPPHPPP